MSACFAISASASCCTCRCTGHRTWPVPDRPVPTTKIGATIGSIIAYTTAKNLSKTPEQFGKFVSYGEIAVGGMLLAPFIPSRLAGLALAAFSGSMIGMYLKTPGMTEEGR